MYILGRLFRLIKKMSLINEFHASFAHNNFRKYLFTLNFYKLRLKMH